MPKILQTLNSLKTKFQTLPALKIMILLYIVVLTLKCDRQAGWCIFIFIIGKDEL